MAWSRYQAAWSIFRPYEVRERALEEGWRVLHVLVEQYIAGRYTRGIHPTVEQMFRKYAPGSDGNDPGRYARFVAGCLGVPVTQRLADLIG